MKYNRGDENNKHYKSMVEGYIGLDNNGCNPRLLKQWIEDGERVVGKISKNDLLKWNKDRLRRYPYDDYIQPYKDELPIVSENPYEYTSPRIHNIRGHTVVVV